MTGKYTVANGSSFTAAGIIYGPGDTVPDSVFTDKAVLASMIAKKRIIETGAGTAAAKTADAETADAKTADKKTDGTKK